MELNITILENKLKKLYELSSFCFKCEKKIKFYRNSYCPNCNPEKLLFDNTVCQKCFKEMTKQPNPCAYAGYNYIYICEKYKQKKIIEEKQKQIKKYEDNDNDDDDDDTLSYFSNLFFL